MDAVAHRHINTSSDSELLLNIFADHLNETGKFRINEEDIFVAVRGLMTQAHGAYACVAMLAGFGIIAFRDPNGIRPLGVARRPTPDGDSDWLCASESAVADVGGFVDWEDVRPGTLFYLCYTITLREREYAKVKQLFSLALACPGAKSSPPQPSRQIYSNMCTWRGRIQSSTGSASIAVGWRWETHLRKRFSAC